MLTAEAVFVPEAEGGGQGRRLLALGLGVVACAAFVVAMLLGGGGGSSLSGSTLPHPETAAYTRVASGVTLAGGFMSYDNVEVVGKRLSEADYRDWDRDRRYSEASSLYPPYNFDTLEVSGYRHLGQPGHLKLFFFNDRLFQAEFVPAEPAPYARKLRETGMRRQANARFEKVDGNLRVVSSVELALSRVGSQLKIEPFVLWQDLRLIREREEWDGKFGSIPRHVSSN